MKEEIKAMRQETEKICRESEELQVKLEQAVNRLADQVAECTKSQEELSMSIDNLETTIVPESVGQCIEER